MLRPPGAEAVTGVEHGLQRVAEPLVGEKEVDEAGAGDLRALDLGQRERRLGELRGELARRLPSRSGELQRRVRRVVAVLGVARPLERRHRRRRAPRAR